MTTVTRILTADVPPDILKICAGMGVIRADLWKRYGALGTVGKSAVDIRKEINAKGLYQDIAIDRTVINASIFYIINDILLYKAAAKSIVKKAIHVRAKGDKDEAKRLYTELKSEKWLSDRFLHRQMRKHFRHGKSDAADQFIVRSDMHTSSIVDGFLHVTLQLAKKYGHAVTFKTRTNGKGVDLTGCNLRVMLRDGFAEIHYASEKQTGRAAGEQTIGVDKGYTEAFSDSDGIHHGQAYGKVLTSYSDVASSTGKQRNKLHALQKKYRDAGKLRKADNILKNNLGRKKLDGRKFRTQNTLRDIAYKAAHALADKSNVIVSEDLTKQFTAKSGKDRGQRVNRRMSAWAKGTLSKALVEICAQRKVNHVVVNAAYTSQMDSVSHLLEGKRVGDKFYRINGDVMQADTNAARNVLHRASDSEITLYTPYKEVKRILLSRSPAILTAIRLELG